jgi:hypothetical protein
MLETTFAIIKSGLNADPTLTPRDRARILASLRNRDNTAELEQSQSTEDKVQRIVRRREAAEMYGCSLRLIDRLAAQGVLRKVRLPGRQRGAGFLKSDLVAVMVSKGPPE